MYEHNEKQLTSVEFTLPFGGRLSPSNRWVKLASMVPWADMDDEYTLNPRAKLHAAHFLTSRDDFPRGMASMPPGSLLSQTNPPQNQTHPSKSLIKKTGII